ncbi:MAG: UDP-N-acetylmuramate dehydrogenase [Oligoflexales bacterium]|nr:UDP-N-acetylmuramate dehydrogenase [Oligoflexales bacterium]
MTQPLKNISYYKTGGSYEKLYCPGSTSELSQIMKEIHLQKTPYFLLGAGSNSLISDEHWPFAVITFSNMTKLAIDESLIFAEAGVENNTLSNFCLDNSLSGLEWLASLPGQTGATVRMNARCYNSEMKDVVEGITSVTCEGVIKEYKDKTPFLGYKKTIFQTNNEIVAQAFFRAKKGNRKEIEKLMLKYREDRNKKDQFRYPSCGCVFKNDYSLGLPSGMLLDKADVHLLGTASVEINRLHANFVFNKGSATSREILETTIRMRDAVYEKFGVWLEYEMEILGIIPDDIRQKLQEKKRPNWKLEKLEPLKRAFSSENKNE